MGVQVRVYGCRCVGAGVRMQMCTRLLVEDLGAR